VVSCVESVFYAALFCMARLRISHSCLSTLISKNRFFFSKKFRSILFVFCLFLPVVVFKFLLLLLLFFSGS
jgi:hypothetical protein